MIPVVLCLKCIENIDKPFHFCLTGKKKRCPSGKRLMKCCNPTCNSRKPKCTKKCRRKCKCAKNRIKYKGKCIKRADCPSMYNIIMNISDIF